jgi:hypothetical protein
LARLFGAGLADGGSAIISKGIASPERRAVAAGDPSLSARVSRRHTLISGFEPTTCPLQTRFPTAAVNSTIPALISSVGIALESRLSASTNHSSLQCQFRTFASFGATRCRDRIIS